MFFSVGGRWRPKVKVVVDNEFLRLQIDDEEDASLSTEIHLGLEELRQALKLPAAPQMEFDVSQLCDEILKAKGEIVQAVERSRDDVQRDLADYLASKPGDPAEELLAEAAWAKGRPEIRWCHHGPECPYCLTLWNDPVWDSVGLLVCLHCRRGYGWTVVRSPILRPAYTTWRREEAAARFQSSARSGRPGAN